MNKHDYDVVIPLSRLKLLRLIAICVVTISVSVAVLWLIWTTPWPRDPAKLTLLLICIVALHLLLPVSMLASGLIAFLAVRKVFDGSPGLTLNNEGIIYNGTLMPPRFARWTDVSGLSRTDFKHMMFVNVRVRDQAARRGWWRTLRSCVTQRAVDAQGDFSISAQSLAIDKQSLVKLISEYTGEDIYHIPLGVLLKRANPS